MKIISYFSYKGGAGRSTLAYNTIPILASEYFRPTKESPMIVVDMDIDSCGMSYLLKADKHANATNCVQYLLGNGCDMRKTATISEHPFLKKLCPVGNAYGYPDNDAILLLPALDGQAITAGNSNYSDSNHSFKQALDSFITVCSSFGVPAIIFDSAVGNNATANISNEEADVIVCCMRPTIQFTNGTFRFLCCLENDSDNEVSKLISPGKDIILVPNVIPQNEVVIGGARYPDTAVSKICNDFITRFDEDSCHYYHFDMLDRDEFGIPAVDRFMWAEGLLYTQKELNDNERLALSRYRKLAALIDSI